MTLGGALNRDRTGAPDGSLNDTPRPERSTRTRPRTEEARRDRA